MSLHSVVIKPKRFKKSFQDDHDFSGVHCLFCEKNTNNKTKRFKNIKSLYYHLREFHRNEVEINFVMNLLQQISIARQLEMIK